MPPTIALLFLSLAFAFAKVYDRCELARELKYVYQFPVHEVSTWVCIVAHESIYDTGAMNPGSGDHGLFQISQLYWCSPPGDGFGCNAPCAAFRDDNIADDVKCVKRIFKEHSRISGDGFNAWAVYPLYCKGDNSRYIRSCFENEIDNSVSFGEEEIPANTSSTSAPNEDDDEGYDFPPLPSPPKKALENSVDNSEEVYEFPALPTTQKVLSGFLESRSLIQPTEIPQHTFFVNPVTEGFSILPPTQYAFGFQEEKSLFPGLPEKIFSPQTETNFFTAITTTPFNTESFTTVHPYSTVTRFRSRLPTSATTLKPFTTYKTTSPRKSTLAYITKKSFNTKAFATKYVRPQPTISSKQLTIKPFSRRPNVTITHAPVIRPPRPPRPTFTQTPILSRPPRPIFTRPTIVPLPSIMPLLTRASTSRPLFSRPTLLSFTRRSILTTNKSSGTSSTSPFQFTQTTVRKNPDSNSPDIFTSETKNIYTIQPASTSTIDTSFKTTKNMKVEFKTSTTLKPTSPITTSTPSSSTASSSSGLKREERQYDNEFPGYVFKRIGNGFRLFQKT